MVTTMKRPLTESNVDGAMLGETHPSAFHVYKPQMKRARLSATNKKRVTFANQSTVDSVESRDSQPLHNQIQMTEEDCRMLWYQKDELVAAKQHMRYLILHGSDETDGSDEMSGLHRYGWERSQHKRSAIYYVIQAHREYPKNHDFVREVSKRCTQWARHLAEEEGFATFCQVYGDPVQIDTEAWEEEDDVSMANLAQTQLLDSTDETAMQTERIASVTPPPSPTFVTC